MVARIKRTQSLSRSLNYNEKKIEAGVAECIQAANYPKDLERLNFYDKLHRLEHQAQLNERVKANSVHISLNFHESDQLNKERLSAIAETYMKEIGFEQQPYLIYRHYDAGHPHIHIVSTNIQSDGSKIEMNNIGRNQSEVARKAIEIKFGLIKAEGRNQKQENELKVSAQKVQYGKTQTKRAITNVLDTVLTQFKYTSLPELNAVLKLYNVMADRGKEDTKMFQKRGLVYSALDEKGNKIGTPIKASDFYSKPTLKYLEQKFVQNEALRQQHQQRLKVAIKWTLVKEKQTLREFTKTLASEGVSVVLRESIQGNIYGITYVDFRTKCVFNGSDLGKEFSAKGILEQLRQEQKHDVVAVSQKQLNIAKPADALKKDVQGSQKSGATRKFHSNIFEQLLKPRRSEDFMPLELQQNIQNKKKSRGRHL
ncbi:relaxase/mobilization nuclease domain-containing protein [Segetibacter koreensis]|uniref:relaxase/mobilization nuclease domain-containing protein n=1 Tax=Segetibacter koreensis TaxID=398037 RepID=UPI00037A6A41|nr:relaxase/mobilization nuclease domain-containing protein [Segetibacter koreensis]